MFCKPVGPDCFLDCSNSYYLYEQKYDANQVAIDMTSLHFGQ